MTPAGCDSCRSEDRAVQTGAFDEVDCVSSFRRVDSCFSARLRRCRRCSTTWLAGYHEDFSGTDVADEWGVRHVVLRPLTDEQVAEVEQAAGTGALDLDRFAS